MTLSKYQEVESCSALPITFPWAHGQLNTGMHLGTGHDQIKNLRALHKLERELIYLFLGSARF